LKLYVTDFLKHAKENKLPISDHQDAVVEKTKQLKKLCSELGSIQKEDKSESINSQVNKDLP
jgi:hypothetical protein